MHNLLDIQVGSMLLVDKPIDWTSFDVVNKIRFALRKALQVKKIKVGHAGTLDPAATGLLIICTGKMTKRISEYQGLHKTYQGSLVLGATTPSYDRETEIDQTYPIDHINEETVRVKAKSFEGSSLQRPPMFSAIKKEGVRLYKLARKNQTVDVPLRSVYIEKFEIQNIAMPNVAFEVVCSKGTYIRSLAYDLGQALDSGAYLSSLRRTHIGNYKVADAWNLDALIAKIESSAHEHSS